MKKLNIFIIIGLILCSSALAIAGTLLSGDSTIELSKADKNTLATKGVTDIIIEELVCGGTYCRACASDGDYGMGCIKIRQGFCSESNETDCIEYTDYTDAELKTNRDIAFKKEWEMIVETIRIRDARVIETKVDEGDVILAEEKQIHN